MRASAVNDLLALYVSARVFGKVFLATNCGRKSLKRAVLEAKSQIIQRRVLCLFNY